MQRSVAAYSVSASRHGSGTRKAGEEGGSTQVWFKCVHMTSDRGWNQELQESKSPRPDLDLSAAGCNIRTGSRVVKGRGLGRARGNRRTGLALALGGVYPTAYRASYGVRVQQPRKMKKAVGRSLHAAQCGLRTMSTARRSCGSWVVGRTRANRQGFMTDVWMAGRSQAVEVPLAEIKLGATTNQLVKGSNERKRTGHRTSR